MTDDALMEDKRPLVERLRWSDGWFFENPWDHVTYASDDPFEAADEIERLREALKDALSHCYNCSGDPHYIEEDEATGDHLWTDCPICRSARAALGGTDD